jgi:hypothetical protein
MSYRKLDVYFTVYKIILTGFYSKVHPQRIHLAIKRSKRCRNCRHILIKPEQKAQATRFKIKLVAM